MPIEFELQMRRETLTPEVQEELDNAKLVEENFDVEAYLLEHDLYSYDPVVVDLETITPFNRHDRIHTTIYLESGLVFLAKIEYEKFKRIRSALLGRVVKTVDDFKVEE